MTRSLLLFALSRLSSLKESSPTPLLRPTLVARMAAFTGEKALVVDPFCFRQFSENEASASYGGTVFQLSIAEFEDIVNARYHESNLKGGYAPFCKHLFVENDFTDAVVNVLPIIPENESKLRSKYEARNDKELPVLTRWFPAELVGKDLPKAKYLDLILYSREQINKENAAQGRAENPVTAPWGIVSIKAQDADHELPMTPITAMRNALGKEEGGSGIPIDRQQYMEAVNYWKNHATVS
ncbi:hypothetical protein FisN_4Hh364 [Fistulifera solaris]|uniref:Flagellar associated protein n=1 Tax=Fistulifera solaris TaxID=1519565 RepID=A0A1Z5KQR0_FISSO|nr:hypothetical protein FisN_4Hh364 [Fistulifera solaris]|eukprot:GAX28445.1 hypothetical protein FisN_4Hh364 [Fistulifera solaris]